MYDVYISDEARLQLGSLVDFIAIKDKEVAVEFRNLILKKIRSLKDMPNRTPVVNESPFWNRYHKLVVTKTCIVLYQIDEVQQIVNVEFVVDPSKIPIE